MKLLYLTPHMEDYGWASYQQDVISEIAKQAEVYFYGPGYHDHTPTDTWADVLAKCPWMPDAVVIGHGWLLDALNSTKDTVQPALNLGACTLPKALILNKEYARLDAKLAYARSIGVNLLLSHHHDAPQYGETVGCPAIFWRFAFNPALFNDRGMHRVYDLSFTGVLINQHVPHTQSDVRLRVQRKLFYCFRDLRLKKRSSYRDLRLFWCCNSSSKWLNEINQRLRGSQRVPPEEYITLFSQSRMTLNSPSPMELVSPRYYESMATGSLIFCVESSVYKTVFPQGVPMVTFAPDLSDFDEKLNLYLRDETARRLLTDAAYTIAHAEHTWAIRVRELLDGLEEIA